MATTAVTGGKQTPLPTFLDRVYEWFAIILFAPDMLFSFFVYSDGNGVDFTHWYYPLAMFQEILWGFLSIGLVGMAWLCAKLAPWHWSQGSKFQSVFCWCGVIIATGVNTWFSLAYRSRSFISFSTDDWVAGFLHTGGVSVTMILVSVMPPAWAFFWSVIQPAKLKKTDDQKEEDHQARLLRMKQEAEVKELRAETNATVRAAQLKGVAATMQAAREQLRNKGGDANAVEANDATDLSASTATNNLSPLDDGTNAGTGDLVRVTTFHTPSSESGEHELVTAAGGQRNRRPARRTARTVGDEDE